MKAHEKEIRLFGGLASMEKTIESFRIALESEISSEVTLVGLCVSLIVRPLTS